MTPAGDATHGGMVGAGGLENGALLHQGAVGVGEIDLSGIDYNGLVFITYDTLPGTFMLIGSIEFIA